MILAINVYEIIKKTQSNLILNFRETFKRGVARSVQNVPAYMQWHWVQNDHKFHADEDWHSSLGVSKSNQCFMVDLKNTKILNFDETC